RRPTPSLPTRRSSDLRDSGTIVVQIGEGSDELFHGYQKYVDAVRSRERFWDRVQRVPRPVRMAASRAATGPTRRVRPVAARLAADRKSTRLNSSHVEI